MVGHAEHAKPRRRGPTHCITSTPVPGTPPLPPQAPGAAACTPGGEPKAVWECRAPPYVVLDEGCGLGSAESALRAAGIRYPLVVKPVWADGRPGTHVLAAAAGKPALARLLSCPRQLGVSLPAVAQQYIPHGTRLFKVCWRSCACLRRGSCFGEGTG